MNFKDKIKELKPQDLNCNVFDVYSYNGLTMQELLCQFFTKINECVGVSNKTLTLAEWLVNEGLKQEVAEKLLLWYNDGTLEELINVTLFENLNNKIDGLNSQLEQVVTVIEKDIDNIKNGIDNANTLIQDIKNVSNCNELSQELLDEFQEIRLSAGDFYINEPLVVSSGQKLILNPKSKLIITGNHDGIILELGGSIEGGIICLQKGITYGSSMLKVIPYQTNNDVNRGERTNIQDMKIIARDATLTEGSAGIHLCDDMGLGIFPVNVFNCCIVNTYTGIKLSGTSNMAWVNGNTFTNVDMFCPTVGIELDCGLEASANKFKNIQIQTDSKLKHVVKLAKNGNYNYFEIFAWDMVTHPIDLFYVGSNATNNEFKSNLFTPEIGRNYVHDLSWNNTYYSQGREFIKLTDSFYQIDLSSLDNSKMYPVVFNSPIKGFICKAGHPSLSIDLSIVPCGWDLLNPMYTVSISQPVDSKMCSNIYGKYEDTRTAIYLKGGSVYNFYDNLYSKVNTLHRDFSTIPKIYTNSYTDSVTGWSVAPKAIGETITNGMYVGFGNTVNITSSSKPVVFKTE